MSLQTSDFFSIIYTVVISTRLCHKVKCKMLNNFTFTLLVGWLGD